MAVRLDTLGDVTWGERLLIARRRCDVNLDEAAKLVSQVTPISYGTLVRLEKLPSAPSDAKRRLVAFLVLLVYGYNPEDFGLSRKDVPAGIDLDAVADLLKHHSGCSSVLAA